MSRSERWWGRLLGLGDGRSVTGNGARLASRVGGDRRAVVVGGGLAGVAAATVLAERGVRVHLLEREAELGGRVRGWDDQLATGEPFQMERGFHAFFRQYYNVRALLRRLDHMGPELRHLVPLDDYPLLGPGGRSESFSGLPTTAPLNVIELVRRTPSLNLRDLVRVDAWAALEMLRYEPERTYTRFDERTAKDYLDSLRFPADARRMLFDVFAHSFFNPEERMSAAELLMMFHFYFMGNREGLVFDVLDEPFSTCLWQPFQRYLERLGVTVELGCAAEGLERVEGEGRKVGAGSDDGAAPRWRVQRAHSAPLEADAVVLAVTVPALKALVDASPDLDDAEWRRAVDELDVTLPFAVWRLWLDEPLRPDRAPFAGTAGCGILDNISVYERFQGEARRWVEQSGGSVVELHAYAVPEGYDEAGIKAEMKGYLEALYPEARDVSPVDERFILARDCPAFAPGSSANRPTVQTPFQGLALAGDLVRLRQPSALMERAVTSGFLAANELLARWRVRGEPVLGIPQRGLLARPRLGGGRTG